MPDYNFRTKINRPQTTYDPTDQQHFYVEDIQQLEQCILDLKARIEALEA